MPTGTTQPDRSPAVPDELPIDHPTPSEPARSEHGRTEYAPPLGRATTVLLTTLVLSAFVMVLNETILSIALRQLSIDLGVTATTVQWLASGFLLTMAVVIPLTGYLLERFTSRQVFMAAMGLFSLGTLLGALAPGFEVLMVGRVVQACGTAVMIPLLMTSVMRLVPLERRGATMGTITIVIAVAPAIGPSIGGAVLAGLGWRWMFWLVLPLAVAALVVGGPLMRGDSTSRPVPADVLSVVLSAIGFGGLVYGLSTLGEAAEGGAALPAAAVALGVAALVVFGLRQRVLARSDRALLDLRTFAHRRFTVAVTLSTLVFLCLIGASAITLPLYLQSVLQTGTFVSGLVLLPGGLVLGLLGRPVGTLYDRVGVRPLAVPGAVAVATSLWLFATLGADSPLALVVVFHVLLMGGLGLLITPLMTDSLSSLPQHLYSHGSAILTTLQQVAGAAGAALFVAVATIGSRSDSGVLDAAGLRAAFIAAGVVGALAVVISLFTSGRTAPRPEGAGAPLMH